MSRMLHTRRAIFRSYHPVIPITVAYSAIFVTTGRSSTGIRMKTQTANDNKYGLARAGPVVVAKHSRSVVVVTAVEEHGRLKVQKRESFDLRFRAMPKNLPHSSSKAKFTRAQPK